MTKCNHCAVMKKRVRWYALALRIVKVEGKH